MAPETQARPRIPVEIVNMAGTALALLAVVVAGAALSNIAPPGVWFTAVSYGLPTAIAFALYCLVARRARPDR